jgi:molybdopterin-biosynthesis enzyme MoeA-like protein
MRLQYTEENLTPARLRMARIPEGAALIHNAVSRAPGYMLENVIVMAGVPRIMQVMMDEVMPRLAKGRPLQARSVRVDAAEGDVAPPLAALQAAHPDVQIGSYPFFEQRRFGTYVVIRAAGQASIDSTLEDLWEVIAKEGFSAAAVDGS